MRETERRGKKNEGNETKKSLAVGGGLGESGLGGLRGFPRGFDVIFWCLREVGFVLKVFLMW